VWLIGAVVCLCAAPRVQLFARAGNGRTQNADVNPETVEHPCSTGWLGSVVVRASDYDRKIAGSTHGRCNAGQPWSTQPSIPPG